MHWARALRSDLYRIGMCQSEMLSTEKEHSPPPIEPSELQVCLLRMPRGMWLLALSQGFKNVIWGTGSLFLL